MLRVVYRTVPVRCLPDRIPVKIEAEVTHLELGEHVATQELKLPEGVVVRLPAEQTLIAVVAPEKEEVVEAGSGRGGCCGAWPLRVRLRGLRVRLRLRVRPRRCRGSSGQGREEEEVGVPHARAAR